LNPTGKSDEDYAEGFRKQPRLRYAAMRAHQEMAAQALAVGATQKLAAKYAGVSPRQIKKYYTDPEFRTRIEELRGVLASKIRGKIYRELDRRTSKPFIVNLEVMDLVRILDRTGPQGGKGMAITVEGDVNVTKYEGILNALFNTDSSGDGADFPQYGDPGTTIPGTSTPVEG